MSSKVDGKEAVVPFEVVHDIYEVLNLYSSGTALRDRLELYRERLRQLGRSAAEIDARLEKAQPVIEAALRHDECESPTSSKERSST